MLELWSAGNVFVAIVGLHFGEESLGCLFGPIAVLHLNPGMHVGHYTGREITSSRFTVILKTINQEKPWPDF